MALTVNAIVRSGGAQCGHLELTVDDEGTIRTLKVSESEIRDYLEGLDGGYKRALIVTWLRHRKAQGRPLTGVAIA